MKTTLKKTEDENQTNQLNFGHQEAKTEFMTKVLRLRKIYTDYRIIFVVDGKLIQQLSSVLAKIRLYACRIRRKKAFCTNETLRRNKSLKPSKNRQ